MTIQPGDILVGDADGVVVLPPAVAAEVLADAQEQERQEEFIAARVAQGESIDGLYPLTEARRPDYQAWLREQEASARPPEPARCHTEPVITGTMDHRAGYPNPSPDAPDAADIGDAS